MGYSWLYFLINQERLIDRLNELHNFIPFALLSFYFHNDVHMTNKYSAIWYFLHWLFLESIYTSNLLTWYCSGRRAKIAATLSKNIVTSALRSVSKKYISWLFGITTANEGAKGEPTWPVCSSMMGLLGLLVQKVHWIICLYMIVSMQDVCYKFHTLDIYSLALQHQVLIHWNHTFS